MLTFPKKHERTILERSIDSVVDLYSLAATKKIYGSYLSSYSEVAAQIGQVPLEVLSTPKDIKRGLKEAYRRGGYQTKRYLIEEGELPKYTRWLPWVK